MVIPTLIVGVGRILRMAAVSVFVVVDMAALVSVPMVVNMVVFVFMDMLVFMAVHGPVFVSMLMHMGMCMTVLMAMHLPLGVFMGVRMTSGFALGSASAILAHGVLLDCRFLSLDTV
ncbi:MAG: hypothetical protein V3573_10265 [Desulfovibrionaceae bacterium]